MRSTGVQRTDSVAIGWHAMHRPQGDFPNGHAGLRGKTLNIVFQCRY